MSARQGPAFVSARVFVADTPGSRSARRGHLAVLDHPHAAPLVIAAPNGVAYDDGDDIQAERAGGRDAVEPGDELERLPVVAHDDGDEHALEGDRAGERCDVLGVEVADVVGDANVDERDVAPGLVGGGGHQALP